MKSKYRTLLSAAVLSVSLVGCGSDNDKKDPPTTEEPSLSRFQGEWVEPGSGLALDIQNDNATAYRYTRETCSVINRFDTLEEAEEVITARRAGGNESQFSFVTEGDSEFGRVELIAQDLPSACDNAPDPEVFDPEFVFEHIWHAFNDYYAFFELRNVDWQQQRSLFRPQVTAATTQQELFDILDEMLAPIDDGHVFLSVATDELEDGFSPAESNGWSRTSMALAQEEDIDEDVAEGSLVELFNRSVANFYGGEGEFTTNFDDEELPIFWGVLEGNVGYLQINSMEIESEDEDSPLSAEEQLLIIHDQMGTVLEGLVDTNALIVDVRFNGGGSDEYSLAIANYFADQRRLAYSKENYNIGNPTPQKLFYIEPYSEGIHYSNPITLITGPDTASAAEIFTLAMMALPQVTHVGEATEGIFSDILSIELMDGWTLGLSSQTYYAPDGQVYESVGVPPTDNVPVTSLTGLSEFGALPAIHEALEGLGVDLNITQAEFDAEVADIMEETGMPGFSAAWIDDAQLLDAAVAGYADVDGERLVTLDTPFNLGSVSKTFVGTSATQMLEQNLITLDTSLSDISMPFMVDSPYIEGNDITLAHLATHSSGIQDGEISYNCGYYIEGDQSSFFAQFDDDFEDCPEPVETNQSNFLSSLLSQSGELYDDDHFLDVTPGQGYYYTNVGAALAAEMLAVASGTSFEDWTENNIFSPLGMNNTHWFNARYSDTDTAPARRYAVVDGERIALPEFALATWSDGGLKSTSTDLANYLLAIVRRGELNGQRILNQESVDFLLSAVSDVPNSEGQQGMFWTNDNLMFGHNGGDPGTTSIMRYDKHNNLGVAVMFNFTPDEDDDSDEADEINDQLNRLFHLTYRRGLSVKAGL